MDCLTSHVNWQNILLVLTSNQPALARWLIQHLSSFLLSTSKYHDTLRMIERFLSLVIGRASWNTCSFDFSPLNTEQNHVSVYELDFTLGYLKQNSLWYSVFAYAEIFVHCDINPLYLQSYTRLLCTISSRQHMSHSFVCFHLYVNWYTLIKLYSMIIFYYNNKLSDQTSQYNTPTHLYTYGSCEPLHESPKPMNSWTRHALRPTPVSSSRARLREASKSGRGWSRKWLLNPIARAIDSSATQHGGIVRAPGRDGAMIAARQRQRRQRDEAPSLSRATEAKGKPMPGSYGWT